MAKQVKLAAHIRSHIGRPAVRKLRQQGLIPATIYGGKEQPLSLHLAGRDIQKLLSHAVGENILVELEIDDAGTKTNRLALIQEVQHHPLRRDVLHVDFHAVKMDEKITAAIPVEPTGEANGVKNFGGLLEQSVRALEVECLPRDLPEMITVDVSALNIGDSIHVKDIPLPDGVTAVDDADLTVFIVAAPKVEEVATATEVAAAPEVIKEKKEDAATGDKKPAGEKK